MSALWRLNLLVALFFALVAMVCLAVLLRQASHDVQRELDAAAAVVAYLGEMAERDPATLRPELTDSLRHVRVRWLSPGQPATDGGDTLLTDWLGTWLYPAELAAPSELQLPGGERLQISVDPSDEVEEVRDSLLQLLALFGVALLLCLLAIRWAVRPGMRVLAELFGALVRIADGRLDTRLPPHRFAEARELAAEAGLAYAFVPIVSGGIGPGAMSELVEVLDSNPGPFLAYCRSGTRSCYLWALQAARGHAPEEILKAAAAAGYDLAPTRELLRQIHEANRSQGQ